MARTKNQIIQEVTDATIARLTPADTPEKISNEVTQDIEGLIVVENISRGKGYGFRVPEVLPNSTIADLMAAMFPIRCVACAGLDADEKFDLLCLYAADGPDAGTYVENENALYRLAIRYNRQLTQNGFNEVRRHLRGTVPRVARTMDPDLIAVNNGMADLGRIYADGLDRDADPEQAREWYAKALAAFLEAEKIKPDPYTQYRIGKQYAAGLGTEQDYEEAALWLEKSADAGYKHAQYTLAGLYRDGKGVEQDYATALELYTKASSSPYAAYELGKLYRDGLGCTADTDRAEWYFRQAFTGFQVMAQRAQDDKLQYRIGWMLLYGVGTDPDEAAALPWLGKSADRGNTLAKYALGKLLLCGETIPRNVDQALELLTECAETGNQYAQYTLGKAYLLGQDVPQDQTEAVHWLRLSAEQGNQYAQYFLDRFYGSIFSSATTLLYHMGNIFQEQRQPPSSGMRVAVDNKLKQKIREKKIAMGHKPDDHEDQEQRM